MCPDCLTSAAKPHHGFQAGCLGCAARAVSRGPNYRESQKEGRQTWKYRAELAEMGVSHEQVRTAATADALRPKA